jgi:hypothetical protein
VPAATREAVQLTRSYPAYADVDGDGSDERCVASSPGVWEQATGTVEGFVRNGSGLPVEGALVTVLGAFVSSVTDAAGWYQILDVPTGTYDLVAAQTGYDSNTYAELFVPDSAVVEANFVVTQSLGLCEDDCTLRGGDLCVASCHGKGLCWFSSELTRLGCDGSFGVVELGDGSVVDCCTGGAYSPVDASVDVTCGDSVVSLRRPVLFRGRIVNMVVTVFNAKECG